MITVLLTLLISTVTADDPLPNVSICVPPQDASNSLYHFRRVARYFRDEDPLQEIRGLDDMSITEALDCYSLGQQAANGDHVGDCPSIWEVTEYAKCQAWKNKRGMTQVKAAKRFLKKMTPILKRKGLSVHENVAAVR